MKKAVTPRLPDIETLHPALPLHASVHPVKDQPLAGVAASCTVDPEAKFAPHVVVVQLMPAGELSTVPLPNPVTDNAY